MSQSDKNASKNPSAVIVDELMKILQKNGHLTDDSRADLAKKIFQEMPADGIKQLIRVYITKDIFRLKKQ